MKKTLVLVTCMLCAIVARAEVTHSIGVQVGFERQLHWLNNPEMLNADKTHLDKTPLNGLKLGFAYEAVFVKGFGLYTGLNYAFTAHTSPWEAYAFTVNGKPDQFKRLEYRSKAEAHTLDLNLELEYKFEIAGNTYLALYTGPNVQWIAKYAASDFLRDRDSKEEQEIRTFVEGYNTSKMAEFYHRWSVAWGIGLAFQFDRYFIRGGYNFGLVNPYKYGTFGEMGYMRPAPYNLEIDQTLTRGRLDYWNIKIGVFLWQSDK